jgi:PAS domain S-box-containing protein
MNHAPEAPSAAVADNSAAWWQNFFNASDDAQIVCRKDGTILHVNPKAARRFRLEPGLDGRFISIFKLLVAPAGRKLAQTLINPGKLSVALHSIITQLDGRPHALVDLEVVPLAAETSLVTFKESTGRLRLEAHVQRLVTAIDATPDVFLVTDAEMHITYVNPAFQSATGYGLEEVLGRSDDFLRATSESEKVNTYRELVKNGREWAGEVINLRRNGESYYVDCTISPIADIAGNFMGYVACERDITMRRQLQNALRVERDFVQSILHSLDGAIYSLDCDFRLTHANSGWRHLPREHGGFLFEGPPAIGRPLLDHVADPARRGELRLAFEEVIATGRIQENHYHSHDGRRWLTRISPWIDGSKVRGLICNIADQTHFQELQEQLFQAQKMEVIGTLAAGVAHDFNNLLQAIRGHASLALLQAESGSPLQKGLEKIDLAATRAADITKQLLSFSRVSESRSSVLDLNQVVKETTQLARRTLRGDIALEIETALSPVRVKMDATRASQALLNLCVNAQDAMTGGGKLTITNTMLEPSAELVTHHCLPPGQTFARCSVSDTGCGIHATDLSKIFQPFFTTKEAGRGTGLGLAIVQRAIQEAGGFIEVESKPGKGSTFHLYLPLVREEVTPEAVPNVTPLSHGKGRVLVVDDVDLLRDFAQGFLEMSGLSVQVAGSGAQAIKILEESTVPFDLIFTDYNMPGMNGVELIEQISVRWPKTKFVLASGYLDDVTRARLESCKASVLSKPYDMHDASQVVLRHLSGHGAT